MYDYDTSGDPARVAWETEELFVEHRESLMRYLRYRLNDFAAAEDIAQECFIRFFQARCRQEVIEQPKAWLFRVAHNLVIDHGRAKKPELVGDDEWKMIEAGAAAQDMESEYRLRVSSLPWHKLTPTEMECLRLRAEGLKFREISGVLDITISTVASYLARAVNKLREPQVERTNKDAGETPEYGRVTAVRSR